MNDNPKPISAFDEMSCSPKFEPEYKVQSVTKRGRFYDWYEEAA